MEDEDYQEAIALLLPAISVEFVFPFVSSELLPSSALTLLESVLIAYVFVHIKSIYSTGR